MTPQLLHQHLGYLLCGWVAMSFSIWLRNSSISYELGISHGTNKLWKEEGITV